VARAALNWRLKGDAGAFYEGIDVASVQIFACADISKQGPRDCNRAIKLASMQLKFHHVCYFFFA
jgi:hypothetical protein